MITKNRSTENRIKKFNRNKSIGIDPIKKLKTVSETKPRGFSARSKKICSKQSKPW